MWLIGETEMMEVQTKNKITRKLAFRESHIEAVAKGLTGENTIQIWANGQTVPELKIIKCSDEVKQILESL
jgi:hypothetical protein